MKNLFYILAAIGVAIISIIAFLVPKDPYKIFPSMIESYKPIWLCIFIFGTFIYLILLNILYAKIKRKSMKKKKSSVK